ncbi:hypothetical protein [Streptomyces parvulus]|uniref:hypothetical protein n=1 Tax=Streptomyces parvulus TaxID=146923 RepID=UPI0034016016
METTQKTVTAKNMLAVTFAIALLLNLVEAVWDPDGQPWLILRIAVSILFGLALVAYIVLWFRRRSEKSD